MGTAAAQQKHNKKKADLEAGTGAELQGDKGTRNKILDIRQIIYFVEVAEQESYSAAAKSLNISQPTLSVAIQKLEKEFGLNLFYYNFRKMNLTSEGKLFYRYARDFLTAYSHMVESSWSISREIVGSVSIAAAPVLSKVYLGELLSIYHQKYPRVSIRVESKWGSGGLESLESQGVDFALKMLPVDQGKYDVIPMVRQNLRLGVHKSHRLAGRTSVSFKELSNETFLTVSDDYSLYQQFVSNCEAAGFTPNIALSSTDCDFLASLVGRNCGVFLMGQPLWDSVDRREIHLLDVTDADVSWDLVLASKKGRILNNAGLAFAELAKEYFAGDRHKKE